MAAAEDRPMNQDTHGDTMPTMIKLTTLNGPLYLLAGSFSFGRRPHGLPGARVWQGPEYLQHAERVADGTMDAGASDDHHTYVLETCEAIEAALVKAGVVVVTT